MMKVALIASSMLFTVPAIAQQAPANPQTAPGTPAQTTPATAPTPTPSPVATPSPGTAPAAQATQPTPSQPPAASTRDQVAQAVARDFGTYDKDRNGQLAKEEFGSWMSTLQAAANPSFKPGSAEANSWVDQAFAQADADKSATVTQEELTTFLTPPAA